ncbi:MAG: trypsin-like peptidase domain-containing protein [Kiritimatiellae bacterium]|nr:trypsin-like peptidase domain-containing protein [Kiritimatiellia bacterium]
MTRSRNRHLGWGLLLIALFPGGCASMEPPVIAAEDAPGSEGIAQSVSGVVIEHDQSRLRELERTVTRMHADGRLTPLKQVQAGLDRRTCRLNLPPPPSPASSAGEIYKNARSSVMLHGFYYKCGRCPNWHVNVATCFALTSDGVFAANYHAFDNRENELTGMVVATEDGRVFPVTEVLAANPADDVCLFRADLGGERVTPLPLAERPEAPGESVYVLSHPSGHHYMFTSGMVSRYAVQPARSASAGRGREMTARMYITADYAKGSSGGPIINRRGEVVGMVSSTASIYYTEENGNQNNLQMVLKLCVPLMSIRALLGAP